MQITPTSALLSALSASPAHGAAQVQPMPPVVAPAATGALGAGQKDLAARKAEASAIAAVAQTDPGAPPARNLPRGSIVNIVV
jgi:hypothetical protein